MTALPIEPRPTQAAELMETPYREGAIGIWVGSAMLAGLLAAGALVPWLSSYPANELVARPLQAPSLEHYFGTDQLGRDVFTRVFSAVYRDLGVAFAGVALPLFVGTLVGVLLANVRHALLAFMMNTLVEAINALPLLVLAIALIAVFGPGLTSIILILGLTNWARYARIAQTRALIVKQQGYLEAVRLLALFQTTHLLAPFSAQRLVRSHRLWPQRLHPGDHAGRRPVVSFARCLPAYS